MSDLPAWVRAPVQAPQIGAENRAAARQKLLTKPQGSLGRLEEAAVRLAGLRGQECPAIDAPHILIFAGDHGIVAEGVSAYPAEVTGQMLANFSNGGAAISVLSRALSTPLNVVDVGTLLTSPPPGITSDKIALGTRNFRHEPAMSMSELQHALEAGARAVRRSHNDGADFILLGEMGIGNTSAASAIAAALLSCSAHELVGAGTGLDAARIAHKAALIEESLRHHRLDGGDPDPAHVLSQIGGHEIAALAGAMIAAAQAGIPLLVDGFICSAAALAATRLNPGLGDWLFFSHMSAERGHHLILNAMKVQPLLDLDLRLGEGSGAALALPLLQMACRLHGEMATFDSAGVSTAT